MCMRERIWQELDPFIHLIGFHAHAHAHAEFGHPAKFSPR